MKILAFPRDPNPYQGLLYGEIQRLGARVSYLGRLTPSRTVNIVALPLELAIRRIAGARLIHVHWVFAFALPAAGRFPVLRRVSQAWFAVWLRTARMLGMHLVWTVHNVLPHAPVFADDVAARRALVAACDVVLAHSPSALDELAALGALPRKSVVIPHGPLAPLVPAESLRVPGAGDGPRRFLFFGSIQEYKGVEELLVAFTALPADAATRLTVAGECGDRGLRARLEMLAKRAGGRVVLRLDRVPDEEVTPLLAAADIVVLPFRRITTSGSALLALAHGRPLIVPDLAALADLPGRAVLRYDGTVPGLTAALAGMTGVGAASLAGMSAAARGFASAGTWPEVAVRSMDEMISVLGGAPQAGSRDRAVAVR